MDTAESADAMLGFNQKTQEHDQWCWAGSSQSVLEYYGSIVRQCTIANWAWGRSDCCGNTDFGWTNTACNNSNYMYGATGDLQDILSHWAVSSNACAYALSQPTCVSEINGGRPFVMRFGWYSGGGHFLDGFGYDNDGQYLHYMDPWPGHGYTLSLYSWVVHASSDHDWTHTLQITTNPPACIYAFAYPYNDNTHSYGAGTSSIQAAYNDPNTNNGYTLYARALGTIENVNFNRNISVDLYGGVSCDYSTFVGLTRISGSLTVSSGSVGIGYILIEP